jgi:hypothetical protein
LGVGERRTLKKLEAAARWWLGADKPATQPIQMDDGVVEGLRRMGVSEEDIAKEQAKRAKDAPPADFDVHADCWESWLFFLKVSRQWLYVAVPQGFGTVLRRCSLNWPGIESVVRLGGVKRAKWAGLVDDLMVIEEAVLAAQAAEQQG